jgi:hypothetical protein
VFIVVFAEYITNSQLLSLTTTQLVAPQLKTPNELLSQLRSPNDRSSHTEQLHALEKTLRDIQHKQAETAERLRRAEATIETQASSNSSSGGLLACDELMSRPGSTYADGYFITRHTTSHKWSPRQDGSREFDLADTCSLKRYTADDARQCLAGKHISLIGDSLTRYQFYSLAYLIDKGTYPPRFPRPTSTAGCTHIDERNQSQCSPPEEPNILMEGDWQGFRGFKHQDAWNEFFTRIGGGDDGGMFEGRMECSCVRAKTAPAVENELYASKPGPGGERIIMSHLNEVGWGTDMDPLKGYNWTNCALNGTCRLSREQVQAYDVRASNKTYDWAQDFVEALSPDNGTLRQMLPPVDIAIYNRGLWGKLEAERAERLFPRLYEWAGNGNGRCFYRSTTRKAERTETIPDPLHAHEIGALRNIAYSSGCSFLDFGHITRDFGALRFTFPLPPLQEGGKLSLSDEREQIYWDNVHFFPWVYEELNNVLLNVLCNWKGI